VSLLTDNRYELRGDRGLVDDFREAVLEAFEERGFEHRLHVDAPRAPEVHDFAKDNQVVTVSCETESSRPMLVIETEAPMEELDALILDATAKLLVKLAHELFDNFEPAQTREALQRLQHAFGQQVERAAGEA